MKQFIEITKKIHPKGDGFSELDWECISDFKRPKFISKNGARFLEYWLTESEIVRLLISILDSLDVYKLKLSGIEFRSNAPDFPCYWRNGIFVYCDDCDQLFRLCLRG